MQQLLYTSRKLIKQASVICCQFSQLSAKDFRISKIKTLKSNYLSPYKLLIFYGVFAFKVRAVLFQLRDKKKLPYICI